MKHISNISVLTLLLCTSFILADQADLAILPLSEQRITAKQVRLQKELAFQGKIRTTLVVAGLGMTGLSVYKMVREIFSVTEIVNLNPQETAVQRTFEQKAAAFAKRFGWFCAETAGAIVVNNMLAKLLDKVMHDESLSWWLRTHAPYQQTVELMEETAFQYAHALTPQDAAQQQTRFVHLIHALLDQCEEVIAFMRHKSRSGTVNEKQLKHAVCAVAQERMNAFFLNLQKYLSVNQATCLSDEIKKFKAELNKDLIRFAYNDQ